MLIPLLFQAIATCVYFVAFVGNLRVSAKVPLRAVTCSLLTEIVADAAAWAALGGSSTAMTPTTWGTLDWDSTHPWGTAWENGAGAGWGTQDAGWGMPPAWATVPWGEGSGIRA
ncbi:hypothetical protein K438DRAFT_1966096 [Mycena galopus ATCC 62051]|nr:hypothetical protein K438DRAFT_1966096 [Mycena galopus ATCC 62051]